MITQLLNLPQVQDQSPNVDLQSSVLPLCHGYPLDYSKLLRDKILVYTFSCTYDETGLIDTLLRPAFQTSVSGQYFRPPFQTTILDQLFRPTFQTTILDLLFRPAFQTNFSDQLLRPAFQTSVLDQLCRPTS